MQNFMTRETLVVALSGGVDSATAAALLVEAGHRVVGMTLRLYDARGTAASVSGRCCGPRDVEDARRVCADLGIPFYVVAHEEPFRAAVIDDFIAEYAAGRTPNPCVKCNEHEHGLLILNCQRSDIQIIMDRCCPTIVIEPRQITGFLK